MKTFVIPFFLLLAMSGSALPAEACMSVFLPHGRTIMTVEQLTQLIESSHPVLATTNQAKSLSSEEWQELFVAIAQNGQLNSIMLAASDRQGYMIMAAVQTLDLKIELQIVDAIGFKKFSAKTLKSYFAFWKALENQFERPVSVTQFAKIVLYKMNPQVGLSRQSLGLDVGEMIILESLSLS